jgi:hypothetical protein
MHDATANDALGRVMAVAALAWLRPSRIRPLPPLGQIPQLPDRDTLWH